MIHKTGNLFDSDAVYLGHGVNCKGMMGAGIAAEFRRRFPHNYECYKTYCSAYALVPGDYLAIPDGSGAEETYSNVIVNFASQNTPGPDATYDWLFSSLRRWAEDASRPDRLERNGNIIAIPEIGCGIGGLEWPLVEFIIECVENMYPEIEFEVWHYEQR